MGRRKVAATDPAPVKDVVSVGELRNRASSAPDTTANLDLGFTLIRDLIARQDNQNTTLDNKANFVLGSATLLLGTYVAYLAARASSQGFTFLNHIVIGMPLALAYLATVFFSFLAYDVRKFIVAPAPAKLVDLLTSQNQDESHLLLLKVLVAAYEGNSTLLGGKARHVSSALAFLFIEAFILLTSLGVSASM